MFSSRRISLIVLAVLVTITGAWAAAQVTPPYPTDFRIIGTLGKGNAPDANGYKVVFYQATNASDPSYASGYAWVRTDANGKFSINVHDDWRLLPLLGTKTYYIGVVKQMASDNKYYGVNETAVALTASDIASGCKIISPDLTLAQGAGINDPGGQTPDGTVPLTITRDSTNTNILVNWDKTNVLYQKPTIYVYTGDGSGTYNDDITKWTKVAENGALVSGVTGFTYAEGQLTHANQVGQGAGEAYYKALWATVTPANSDPKTGKSYFQECWAGGKLNVTVAGAGTNPYKYSFVSVPFASVDPSADVVFGGQVPAGSSKATATELWGWTGTGFGNQMYLDSTTKKWTNISGFSSVTVASYNSYVFKTKGGSSPSDATMTVVGNVVYDAGTIPVGANLYTLLANPYPVSVKLDDAKLDIPGGVIKATAYGYADQLWGWTGAGFGQQVYFNTTGGWTTIGSFANIPSLRPGFGYVYKRYTLGAFNWGFKPF